MEFINLSSTASTLLITLYSRANMSKKNCIIKDEKAEEPVPEKKEQDNSTEMLAKLAKADLGMLSDEELENGIKLAAQNEDYILASKLRDELKGRKEGN